MQNNNQGSMRLPTSAANSAFYTKAPISSGMGCNNNISEIIAKSKKFMGLDETRTYLSSPHGDPVEDSSSPVEQEKPLNSSSPVPTIQRTKAKFCTNCGTSLTESARFCSSCGGKL